MKNKPFPKTKEEATYVAGVEYEVHTGVPTDGDIKTVEADVPLTAKKIPLPWTQNCHPADVPPLAAVHVVDNPLDVAGAQ